MTLMNKPEFESPEERNALAICLENETLLKVFLKGFTGQTGPLSSDTSACISTGLQNLDLHAMMLTNPEGPDTQATMIKDMAGRMITLSCLNEDEWKTASPALDLQPEGREALQCVMNKLGGPEGIVASLEFKEGRTTHWLSLNAATECGLTIMMEEPYRARAAWYEENTRRCNQSGAIQHRETTENNPLQICHARPPASQESRGLCFTSRTTPAG